MARCTLEPQDGAAGFATALAMTVGLAIGLTATVLLVRSELDLLNARRGLERVEAEYRLDAVQSLAARLVREDSAGMKLHRVDFESTSANVQVEDERGKLLPSASAGLPDAWFTDLGVMTPAVLKDRLGRWRKDRRLSMQALADLDTSAQWKACAAQVISAHGASPSAASAIRRGALRAAGSIRTVRLRAIADDGWVDDRIVRLTADPSNPVVVLDRRFYRRRGEAMACPAAPDFGTLE